MAQLASLVQPAEGFSGITREGELGAEWKSASLGGHYILNGT